MKTYKKILAMFLSFVMIFSSLTFTVFGEETLPITIVSDWKGSIFGDVGGQDKITSENFEITEQKDQTVTLRSSNNRGKIASSDEGIAFYYKEVPVDTNFELKATGTIEFFDGTNNQVSFGLMIRDNILVNEHLSKYGDNYIAVGPLEMAKDTALKAFYKTDSLKKIEMNEKVIPVVGDRIDLTIKKSGNLYLLQYGVEEVKIDANEVEIFDGDTLYVGLFTARNAKINYSDVEFNIEEDVEKLEINSIQMKTSYLVGQEIDVTGLQVKALYASGKEKILSESDYIITGFDSSVAGTNTIQIHYNGAVQSLDLKIEALTITSIDIKYLPAKTEYYVGDMFDPQGLVLVGDYNQGYVTKELTEGLYSFHIDGKKIGKEYKFESAGTKMLTVQSTETPKIKTKFKVVVSNAKLTALDIKKNPEKTTYFIGDLFDSTGMVVYAKYSDGSEVRLMSNDYTITGFDSTTPGDKVIVISHKDQSIELDLIVKEKEVIGLEIKNYPKTTYDVGEELDFSELEIWKVYDNGEREKLETEDYTIDSTAYNELVEGTYDLIIVPQEEGLESIFIPVTVRKEIIAEWKSIVFGQSISKARNYLEINDGTIKLVAEEGGGKVTGDHDGITFYYTELDAKKDNFVLSADIKVEAYAKTPHDGQESFGIMARDAIGTHMDSSVFASNLVGIGGYSGGTRNDNGTQLFVRTGIKSPDGAGSEGIKSIMLKKEKPTLANTHPEKEYKLTLSKTNSGFTGSINDGKEEILFTPDILNVQDGKMYVGFYVARLATIEVSNIELAVTSAHTDAPRMEAPAQPIEPIVRLISPETSSKINYDLKISSNVDGVIIVKQGDKVISREKAIKAGEIITISTKIANKDKTNFSITFLPNDTENLTSYNKIVENFTVDMQTFLGKSDIYVSPIGRNTGKGTKNDPLDLDTAITFVQEGQKIILLEGIYDRSTPLNIRKYNDGTATAKKYLWAEEGAKVVIDFNKKSEGGLLSGNYWHIKGIDFINSAGNTKGFTVGGNHNIIELCNFYNNGDTGLQISRTDSSANTIDQWPSYNLILNCTSYNNSDPSQNNADGFAAKLTSGVGNVFDGCIAHNNVDDGWDLYTKAGSGAIGAVTIKNSIAYGNGRLTDGKDTKGDGNGFKLGGEGIHVPHIIENSLAFDNEAYGFTSNSNPGLIARNNCAFNNVKGNADFRTYAQIETDFIIDGFISYQKQYSVKDNYPLELQSDKNFMFDGSASVNSLGVKLADEDFVSLTSKIPYERDEKGNIIWGDFLKFIGPQSK